MLTLTANNKLLLPKLSTEYKKLLVNALDDQ